MTVTSYWIVCQDFYFPSPRLGGPTVHPATHRRFIVELPQHSTGCICISDAPGSANCIVPASLNSGHWPLTMYICLNQTVPYLLILGIGQPSECFCSGPCVGFRARKLQNSLFNFTMENTILLMRGYFECWGFGKYCCGLMFISFFIALESVNFMLLELGEFGK